MTNDARAVSNFVLDYCGHNEKPVTNLTLQKLLYFLHAWTLISKGHPLVRQKFEAWQFGPVIQSVYREFKDFGNQPITGRATLLNVVTGKREMASAEISDLLREFLEGVLEFYVQLTAAELVRLSHVAGGPWHVVWNHKGHINPGMYIEDDSIRDFYSRTSVRNKSH